VVAKAEYLEKGENPRYLVTSLETQGWPAQKLYERLYCARGEMENRIKEQLSLFSDRLSTETLRANQLGGFNRARLHRQRFGLARKQSQDGSDSIEERRDEH
jgi:hypothetical protein